MAERLGIVLYWTGCIFAGLWLLLMLSIWSDQDYRVPEVSQLVFAFLPALLLWLLGKGMRFIFSGK